jgi:hypothetical protein
MKASEIINEIRQYELSMSEVTVPIINKSEFTISVNGLPYPVKIDYPKLGWFIVKPLLRGFSEVVREANLDEIRSFLNPYPEITTIIIERTSNNTYMVFPANILEAESKGFYIEPTELFLAPLDLKPLSYIKVRKYGDEILYDSFFRNPKPVCFSKEEKIVYDLIFNEPDDQREFTDPDDDYEDTEI